MLSPSLQLAFVGRPKSLGAGNFHLQRRIAECPQKHSDEFSDNNQNDDARSFLPALLVSATTREIGGYLASTTTHSKYATIPANTVLIQS
jgi:hypothetical protein